MKKRRLTILIMMLTMLLWAARPVALADGIEWLRPDPGEPEQGEEQSPAAAPETEWLTPDEAQEEMTPIGVSTPGETEWLTPDEVPAEPAPTGEAEEDPVIDVTVPGSGELVINPHRLPVELNGETVRDQIVNGGQLLTSHSEVPVMVSASLTVDTGQSGGLTVTESPIAAGEREKLGYIYVEFQNLADSEGTADWSGEYTGASNQLLAKDGETSSGEVLRIGAGDGAPAYGAYRLFGQLSENPETGWQSGDRLSVTVSFTFRPAEGLEPSPARTRTGSEAEPEPESEAGSEAEPQSESKEVSDHDPETTADTPSEMASAPAPAPVSVSVSVFDYDYDTGPDPSPEPESSPAQEDQPETRGEQVESFASGSNPDWMLPPGESGKER